MPQLLQVVDDDYDSDELMWVKAGGPGEKPTIIRPIRSESSSSGSRDNSGGSCHQRKLLSVENGKVYSSGPENSSESLETLERIARSSSNDSRVIVVNIPEAIYPTHVDKQRIQRFKAIHSPRTFSKIQQNPKDIPVNNNNTIEQRTKLNCTRNITIKRPLSQPTRPISNCSPNIERCASAEPTNSPLNRIALVKGRDEGYTSLTEDCKDSDTESVRSKSLPSSWKPIHEKSQRHEKDLHKYAQRMTSNNSTDCAYLYHEDDIDENKPLNKKDINKSKRKLKNSKLRHNIENAIEICTCFVCLRSAVYHAEDEDDTDSLVDHPCSCEQPGSKCCGRWAVISLMVCFLPFLLCYPPLKSCLCIHDRRKKLKQEKNEKKLLKKQREQLTGKGQQEKGCDVDHKL